MPLPELRLRELERADLPRLNAWRNDPALAARLGGSFRHVCLTVDEAWYERYLATRANNVRLAICEGEAPGAIVGAIYLLDIDWQHGNAELAIWIGESRARGRGVGRFAVRAMLCHAFDDLGLHRVYLSVLSDNEPAIALYRRCGFSVEGVQREAVFKQGRWRDLTTMAVLADDSWEGKTR